MSGDLSPENLENFRINSNLDPISTLKKAYEAIEVDTKFEEIKKSLKYRIKGSCETAEILKGNTEVSSKRIEELNKRTKDMKLLREIIENKYKLYEEFMRIQRIRKIMRFCMRL
jgi:ribosomal protein L15E